MRTQFGKTVFEIVDGDIADQDTHFCPKSCSFPEKTIRDLFFRA